jgi:hypothetical protein
MLTFIAAINPQPDGSVTIDAGTPDGAVFSCNESGGLETRPVGSAGPWEKAKLDGLIATFSPNAGKSYVFTLPLPK